MFFICNKGRIISTAVAISTVFILFLVATTINPKNALQTSANSIDVIVSDENEIKKNVNNLLN